MITLPNGDKWIIDDSELKDRVTDIREFISRLISDNIYFPCKLTKIDGEDFWDNNVDPYQGILGEIAFNKIETDFFQVYEMPWGEVLVVYTDADSGGYDVCTKVKVFANKAEYTMAVLL